MKNKLAERFEYYLRISRFDDLQKSESLNGEKECFLENLCIYTLRIAKLYSEDYEKYELNLCLALRDYLMFFNREFEDFPYNLSSEALNKTKLQLKDKILTAKNDEALSLNQRELLQSVFELKNLKTNNLNFSKLITDEKIYHLTGYRYFKSMEQKLAVYGALRMPKGYTGLICLPTGAGKSLITQLVGFSNIKYLSIVIVPTVSLLLDQFRSAKDACKDLLLKERIQYYIGGEGKDYIRKVIDQIKNRELSILYLSPEAIIKNSEINNALISAAQSQYLNNIIIDEAHLVIDWGSSFRIDYFCSSFFQKNLLSNNKKIRTYLLSATITNDNRNSLKKLFSENEKWIELRFDCFRKEPRFMLFKEHNQKNKIRRVISQILLLPHPMIVYVQRPDDAQILKELLQEEGLPEVLTFTGKTTTKSRKEIIDKWNSGQINLLIATSAFGIGVDKPDVRTVINAYLPPDSAALYQEVGRGGRDGLPFVSATIINNEDNIDLNLSKKMNNKQILSAEKMAARWIKMVKNSKNRKNVFEISTAINPDYSVKEEDWTDEFYNEKNEAHIRWNLYVIMLLQEAGLITIKELKYQNQEYLIELTINDDKLLMSSEDNLKDMMKQVRKERKKSADYKYNVLKDAVLSREERCWSEQFFAAFPNAEEYCPGCKGHSRFEGSLQSEKLLRICVKEPVSKITENERSFFNSKHQALLISEEKPPLTVLENLTKDKSTLVVVSDAVLEKNLEFIKTNPNNFISVLAFSDFLRLADRKNYYFASGRILFFGSDNSNLLMEELQNLDRRISKTKNAFYYIVVAKDYINSSNGKRLSEIIDGPTYYM